MIKAPELPREYSGKGCLSAQRTVKVDIAAIDVHPLTGGVAGAVGEQECRFITDLFGGGHTMFQRNLVGDHRQARLLGRFIAKGLDPIGIERSSTRRRLWR